MSAQEHGEVAEAILRKLVRLGLDEDDGVLETSGCCDGSLDLTDDEAAYMRHLLDDETPYTCMVAFMRVVTGKRTW